MYSYKFRQDANNSERQKNRTYFTHVKPQTAPNQYDRSTLNFMRECMVI